MMVEIIRDVKEMGKNVSKYLESENKFVKKEYNNFRKKLVKVLKIIRPLFTLKQAFNSDGQKTIMAFATITYIG